MLFNASRKHVTVCMIGCILYQKYPDSFHYTMPNAWIDEASYYI